VKGEFLPLTQFADIARQPYDVHTTVLGQSYGPYELADLLKANSHGSRTNSYDSLRIRKAAVRICKTFLRLSYDPYQFVRLSYDCRTLLVHLSYELAVCIVMHVLCMQTFSPPQSTFNFYISFAACCRSDDLKCTECS